MKRLFRFFMVFLLIGMFMAGAAFIALAMYYRDNFPVNTWINGVYCTGRTVQEVNEELALGQGESVISIVDGDGTRWEMDMGEAGFCLTSKKTGSGSAPRLYGAAKELSADERLLLLAEESGENRVRQAMAQDL